MKSKLYRGMAIAVAMPVLALSAKAQPAPNGTAAACVGLSGIGVNFGSPGNSADKSQVVCDMVGDTQISLSAIARFNGANPTPPPVVETSPGTYLVMAGAGNPIVNGLAQWNFNYAITTPTGDAFTAATVPANVVFTLSVDRDPGLGVDFQNFVLNVGDNPDTQLSFQNSENEGFFNLPGDVFDPNKLGTYTFGITEKTADTDRLIGRSSINVVVGTPEPASIALMATGLFGVMGIGYKKRRNNS